MNNELVITASPLQVEWQELPLSPLLKGKTPQQAMQLITHLYTLCGEAQKLAASLLLLPQNPVDLHAAQQELVQETLRRALCDWLPAWSGRQATMDNWSQLRSGQYHELAQQIFFTCPAERWLAQGAEGWSDWCLQQGSEVARWITQLWPVQTPPLFLASEPDKTLLTLTPKDVSPLALEYTCLQKMAQGNNFPALRLLARCITLARAMTCANSLRWHRFEHEGWQVAVVESARGWLIHQMRWEDNGTIAEYCITPPTRQHTHPQGLIKQTLSALAESCWYPHLLLLDPCVEFTVIKRGITDA
ncbi:MAG: ATP/GTP-binding protein [Enterobacteriaceae bacterium]